MIRSREDCTLVAACDIRPLEALEVVTDLPSTVHRGHVGRPPGAGCRVHLHPQWPARESGALALEHGHHVIIEAMALNRKDGEAVLHKALEVGKQVFCVMQNRYSPPSVWLKDMVDSGRLGRIHMVQVNCFWNRDDRYYGKIPWKGTLDLDGGTLFTQFSHFVDILYWLFGDIHGIQARFAGFHPWSQHGLRGFRPGHLRFRGGRHGVPAVQHGRG